VRSRLRNAPQALERRAFKRIAAGLDAQVVSLDGVELSWPIRGVIEDLSAGGLRLRTDWPFERGSSLRIVFALAQDDRGDEADVEVVASEPAEAGQFTVHCRIVTLPRKTWWNFLDWMLARGR
jgi:hypothetical protein